MSLDICCLVVFSFSKEEKSSSSCRASVGDKEHHGNNCGPPSLFCPDFFFSSDPCLCLPPTPCYTELPNNVMACSTKKYLALTKDFYQHIKMTQLSPFQWSKNQDSNTICVEYDSRKTSLLSSQAMNAGHTHQKRGSKSRTSLSVMLKEVEREEKEEEAPVPHSSGYTLSVFRKS